VARRLNWRRSGALVLPAGMVDADGKARPVAEDLALESLGEGLSSALGALCAGTEVDNGADVMLRKVPFSKDESFLELAKVIGIAPVSGASTVAISKAGVGETPGAAGRGLKLRASSG